MRPEFRRRACLAVMALALTSTAALGNPVTDRGGHDGLAPLAMSPLLQPTPIGTDRILLEATLTQPVRFNQVAPLSTWATLPEVQTPQGGLLQRIDMPSGMDLAAVLRGTDRI